MTEDTENIVKAININQVLIAILEEHGPLTVSTLKFLEAGTDKELIIDYDENGPSFTFRLKDKDEE